MKENLGQKPDVSMKEEKVQTDFVEPEDVETLPSEPLRGEAPVYSHKKVEEVVINLGYVDSLVTKLQKGSRKLKLYKDAYDEFKEKYDKSAAAVEDVCEQYINELNDKEGIKSMKLPCGGVVKLTALKDLVTISDGEKALHWVLANKRVEFMKQELQISKISAHYKATGDLLPGVEEETERGNSFSMKINTN